MRLIDGDALKENIEWRKSQSPKCDEMYWDDILERIDAQPAVDAVQVKNGWWKRPGTFEAYDIYGVKTWALKAKCSECGFVHHFIEAHMCYGYCPNCGAKMDGERRENNDDAT